MISKTRILEFFIVLLLVLNTCSGCSESVSEEITSKVKSSRIDSILNKLNEETNRLETYQCRLEYLFSQPLFDSQTLRKGDLYYIRDSNNSALRINFNTIKQDDESEEKQKEQFLFDGFWLTRIDYQLKEVKKHQVVDPNEIDPNKPADAFELISENFPIIGFTKTDKLKEQFEIELVEPNDKSDFIHLHLKVKPDSVYKDDYTSIDFWIDQTRYLPAKIIAASTEEDIYQLKFLEPKVNEKINEEVFKLTIPNNFPKPEVILLKSDKSR